jgi:hypothetical protein
MLAVVRGDPSPVVSYFIAVVLIWTVSVTVLAVMVWPVLMEIIGRGKQESTTPLQLSESDEPA